MYYVTARCSVHSYVYLKRIPVQNCTEVFQVLYCNVLCSNQETDTLLQEPGNKYAAGTRKMIAVGTRKRISCRNQETDMLQEPGNGSIRCRNQKTDSCRNLETIKLQEPENG